jgi:hypothetical protein
MRRAIAVSLLTVASTLVSCASMRIGDTRIYGFALSRVTLADIQAAMRADEASHKHNGIQNDPITEVDVVSRDEMHIYHGRRLEGLWFHCVVERINGKWRYTGAVVFTS